MDMVREQQSQFLGSRSDTTIEFIPCLAAIHVYADDDGNEIRYLANFVYHDGSSMTKFLDDDGFRQSLKRVVLVGYEWLSGDDEHIAKYFETSNLPTTAESVQPNYGFDTLQEEMDEFKKLDETERRRQLEGQTMGPSKMALFVIDAAKRLRDDGMVDEKEENFSEEENDLANEEILEPRQHLVINPELERFACRICRTILFSSDHLAKDHVQNLHSFKRANFNARRPTVACQSLFCNEDVLGSLSENGQDIEGKLACPKCEYKIGHWKWSGAQCSCGTWVTPAIQIPMSKVDRVLPLSEISSVKGIIEPILPNES
eukprot:scaffold6159_cov207-Cylindrotheca_fusiformis.AAC.3